uniref:Uncharacterized protein n=1 Tax=viral metagenome TaxID=1070528 RepID=A0A6M3M397_9ZZZZ
MYYENGNGVLCYAGIRAISIAANTAYMVVDLSDTTNWKHQYTDHIDLCFVNISINGSDDFNGRVELGYLENVDAENGDMRIIKSWPIDDTIKYASIITDNLNFDGKNGYFHCNSVKSFLPMNQHDQLFQTDVNITGPDGNVLYPSGNGDLVLKITRGAGNVSVGLLVGYVTPQ